MAMAVEHLRLDASIPFSAENLHALRGFARQPSAATRVHVSTAVAPDEFAHETVHLNPNPDYKTTNHRTTNRRYDSAEQRCSKIGIIVIGLIFVIFVGIVITMMGMLYQRVNHVLDRVDGEEMNAMVTHAVASARNTEEATANLAKASSVAHALALQVQPSVVHVLNSTDSMIDQARSFAFHPQWTISGG